MKNSIVLLCILFSCNFSLFATEQMKQPVDYVNLFSGTSSSRWMLYPGPSMPFGMIKLSPDNTDEWSFDAGYEYTVESICGFGHVHSWMMGSFLTMPITGGIKTNSGTIENPDSGYRSRISHKNENASPGYYSVMLDDYNIKAELTATTRAGLQRYTFPESQKAHIIFDLNIPEEGQAKIVKAMVRKVSDTEIEGFLQKFLGWNEYTLHFVAQTDKPFTSFGGWTGTDIINNSNEISVSENKDIGAFITFSTQANEVIQLKTALSYVSIEQARLNLNMELDNFGWDFDAVRKSTSDTWNDLLSKITIEGGTEKDKTKFYTNLYRAFCARTIFSDANGKYVDMCENVQQLPDPNSPVYGCDAFWNIFWNLNQLWALVTPDIMNKWVNSLLEIYDRGGWLSKGPGGIEYSSIMVASHEIPLIVAAYQQGIRNFDVEKAYKAIKEIQTTPGTSHECGGYVGNHHLKSYMEMGYVPADEGPVSNTLEYSYDDWCAAQFAKALGKQDDYEYFMKRSQNYKNVYDPTTGYVRPKHAGGPWQKEFVPLVKAVGKEDNFGGKDYVEGNAWQYSWFAPQDVPGLIEQLGIDEFNNRLNEGFELSRPNFVSQYVNHSNQPNMQPAFLFNYSGKPWLTQYWTREILDNYYGLGPVDGYPGDEDQGQMGAWYVMAAMGLFQTDGGVSTNPFYEIASPLFDKVTIQLDQNYFKGKSFTIEAINNSQKNRYIQSARLNGKVLDTFWFPHKDLVNGGELVLIMGPKPNKSWASDLSKRPPQEKITPIVTTPYVESDAGLFLDKTEISLACDTKNARIYYTSNGDIPSNQSTPYNGPFNINESTTIKMRAFKEDRASLVNTAHLQKANLSEAINPGQVQPGLAYKYFEGTFSNVSDLQNEKPLKMGTFSSINLGPREQDIFYALEFSGYIEVPRDGLYNLYLTSNDGSTLSIDSRILVNNDGLHPVVQRSQKTPLKKGLHAITVKFFQTGGGHHLSLFWKGPGIEKEEVPAEAFFH